MEFAYSIHETMGDVEGDWRAFENDADFTPFQSFDWLDAWRRHVGGRRGVTPVIVVARQVGGGAQCILPLMLSRRGPVRVLSWLGGDLSDYNAPLLAPGFAEAIGPAAFRSLWAKVLAMIAARPGLRFHVVDLRKMPEHIGAQRNPFMDLPLDEHPSGSHRTSLTANWEQFYRAKRPTSVRQRERNKEKRLAAIGKIRLVEPKEPEDVKRTLDVMFAYKAQALTAMGAKNVFATPGVRDFFDEVAANPATAKLIHVARLDVGETIGAASFGLTLRGSYYYVVTAYKRDELAAFSPGSLHLRELMRRAIERGFSIFDFTIGDEGYKHEWRDGGLRLYDHRAAPSLWAAPLVVLNAAFSRSKRFVKQSPRLASAYFALRSRIGLLRSSARTN